MAEWVIIELTQRAETEDPDIVRQSIRRLTHSEVFVPASVVQRGEDRVISYLIEGYAFVCRENLDGKPLNEDRLFRLEGSRFVQSIVTKPDGRIRRLACVQQADIEKFRQQIKLQEDQGIEVGDLILITSGPYKNLKAIVIEDIPEQDAVQVHVQLRSKDSLVTLPRAFLRLHEKAAKPPFYDRKQALRLWLDAAMQLATWSPDPSFGTTLRDWLYLQRVISTAQQVIALNAECDPSALQVKHEEWARHDLWVHQIRSHYAFFAGFMQSLDPTGLTDANARLQSLTHWVERTNALALILRGVYSPLPTQELSAKFAEWSWLEGVSSRVHSTSLALDRIMNQMETGGYQNLIVDGHNLAIRCATAPGLRDLSDSQGRPTGAIVGFLNALASLKKKNAAADIYVVWDGSSQRRKALFPGYKEGRGNPRSYFEVQWLQEHLPLFGVHQVLHPKEEADDVIATLVQGQLAGQLNVILSTDRDLLQLVTPSTSVLVPAVGSGKEKLFGPLEVEAEYGVAPGSMLQLRALSGDTSDAIPGCPNCGLKTAAKLLKLYGTVDKLLSSNMAGLTKSLVANLRSAEKQVRLNVKLMSLISDLPLTFIPPDANAKSAQVRMQELQMKPDRLVSAFFGPVPTT